MIFGSDGNLLPKYSRALNEHVERNRRAANHVFGAKDPTGIMIECPRCGNVHERCSRRETTVRCKNCGLRIHQEALPENEQTDEIMNGGVQ